MNIMILCDQIICWLEIIKGGGAIRTLTTTYLAFLINKYKYHLQSILIYICINEIIN